MQIILKCKSITGYLLSCISWIKIGIKNWINMMTLGSGVSTSYKKTETHWKWVHMSKTRSFSVYTINQTVCHILFWLEQTTIHCIWKWNDSCLLYLKIIMLCYYQKWDCESYWYTLKPLYKLNNSRKDIVQHTILLQRQQQVLKLTTSENILTHRPFFLTISEIFRNCVNVKERIILKWQFNKSSI